MGASRLLIATISEDDEEDGDWDCGADGCDDEKEEAGGSGGDGILLRRAGTCAGDVDWVGGSCSSGSNDESGPILVSAYLL
jgi:hypothetical protein